jgi:hypothetical protein
LGGGQRPAGAGGSRVPLLALALEGLTPLEREQAIFLWQFWTEQTLVFKNYAGNKFKWALLMGLADRLGKRLVEEQSPLRH